MDLLKKKFEKILKNIFFYQKDVLILPYQITIKTQKNEIKN